MHLWSEPLNFYCFNTGAGLTQGDKVLSQTHILRQCLKILKYLVESTNSVSVVTYKYCTYCDGEISHEINAVLKS